MKTLHKGMIQERKKVQQIMTEKRVLSKIKNPFIVNLHWAF